ncbi:hypothetical protein LOAG_13513 [Loa loa]|uniref:Uncharacterized protein n=1 Tax=Loa loa TaxID=7209 RepID=A0A1S0TJW1_LOALO|nr:hypothetical protein LOAG_13513 [Loa loa]EFO15001.1 hypothetical protein LOAG_13513 [Loa loa]
MGGENERGGDEEGRGERGKGEKINGVCHRFGSTAANFNCFHRVLFGGGKSPLSASPSHPHLLLPHHFHLPIPLLIPLCTFRFFMPLKCCFKYRNVKYTIKMILRKLIGDEPFQFQDDALP